MKSKELFYHIKRYLLLKKHERIIWDMLLGCLPLEHQLILKHQFEKTEKITRQTAGPFCLTFYKKNNSIKKTFPAIDKDDCDICIPLIQVYFKIDSNQYQAIVWIVQGELWQLQMDVPMSCFKDKAKEKCCIERFVLFPELLSNRCEDIFQITGNETCPAKSYYPDFDLETLPIKKEIRQLFINTINSKIPDDYLPFIGYFSRLQTNLECVFLGLGNIELMLFDGELYYCLAALKDEICILVKYNEFSGQLYEALIYEEKRTPRKILMSFSEYFNKELQKIKINS